MTSKRVGERIGAASAARRREKVGAAMRAKQTLTGSRERRGLLKLAVCSVVFTLMVAAKLLLPARMAVLGGHLDDAISQNMDVKAVFSALGRAATGEKPLQESLQDAYQAVFHPSEEPAVPAAALTDVSSCKPLASLQAFRMGKVDCGDWATVVTQRAEKNDVSSMQAASETPAAAAQTTADAGEDVQTMALTSVLYTGEDLPENVCMEQTILGFDYCTPVLGTLSSGFGYREHPLAGEERFHYGVDLAADTGTDITCFANGTVTAVGESSSYGKYMTVTHAGGFSTLYAHCSRILASSGAAVKEGEKIAEVGETGQATGPHLHFEIHNGEDYQNPIYYVSAS